MTTLSSKNLTRNMSASTLKIVGLVAATSVLAGCATMGGGLSPAQCQQSNWQAIGYQDGLMGRSQDFIQKHIQQCAKANIAPNQTLWQKGREEGLKRYCTPLRAYQLGREGYEYNDVCPQQMTLELLKAHDEGYINYQREQTLQQVWYDNDPFWDSPFYGRFGYGGWMHPFYPHSYPRITPNNSYPKYIDSQTPPAKKPVITPTDDVKIGSNK